MLNTIIAALLFYVLPVSVGTLGQALVRYIFKRTAAPTTPRQVIQHTIHALSQRVIRFFQGIVHGTAVPFVYPLLVHLVFPFALGVVMILGYASISKWITTLDPQRSFETTFFPSVYLSSVIGICVWIYRLMTAKTSFWPDFRILALVGALSLLSFGIWQWRAPYPLNWDLYEHQTLSSLVQSGEYDFHTGDMSDTFGFASYPPSFHLLLALSQTTLNPTPENILQYWYVLSFLHLLLISAASYYLGYVITTQRSLAIVSCIVGTLSFESVIAFTSFFILPQTLTAVLWAFLTIRLLSSVRRSTLLTLPEVVLSATALIVLHFVIGSIAALLYLGAYLFFRFSRFLMDKRVLIALWIAAVLVTVGAVTLTYQLDFSDINQGEAALYSFSLTEKWQYFRQMYGLLPLVALAGIVLFIKKQRQTVYGQVILLSLLAVVALFISNIPYVFKFLTLGRFLILAMVAYTLSTMLQKSRMRLLLYAVTIVWCAGILASTTWQWQEHLLFNGQVSHVSSDDLAAAHFLREHYAPQTTLILSDPGTAYLLEGLSGVNSAGGAFAAPDTRERFRLAGLSGFTQDGMTILKGTTDPVAPAPNRYLLALSGRSFRWLIATPDQQNGFDFNFWRSEQLSEYNLLTIRAIQENNPDARQVFASDSVVIFEL